MHVECPSTVGNAVKHSTAEALSRASDQYQVFAVMEERNCLME